MNDFAEKISNNRPYQASYPDRRIGLYMAYDIQIDSERIRFHVDGFKTNVLFVYFLNDMMIPERFEDGWTSHMHMNGRWYLHMPYKQWRQGKHLHRTELKEMLQ